MRILFGKFIQFAFGALLGGIAGAIITGDDTYMITLSIVGPIAFTVIVLLVVWLAGSSAVKKRQAAAAAQPTGINATLPDAAPEQKEAVLNPVSSAQPSPGVVLNGQPVDPPKRGAVPTSVGPRLWRAVGIATIVVGFLLPLIPAWQTIAWIGEDVVAGRPFDGRDMTVGIHQQQAFDQVTDLIGSTEVVSVYFFDDYIRVSAPYPAGSRTVDSFVFKYGRASREGPDYSQPDSLQESLFDAGAIDMSLIAKLTRQSLDDAKIEDVEDVYPSITRFGGDDPEIRVEISGTYFDASYEYTVNGEFIRRSGSAFE